MYCLEKSCFCALQTDGLLSPISPGVAGAGLSQVRSHNGADLRPGSSEDKACPGRARLAATRALVAPGSCRSSGEKGREQELRDAGLPSPPCSGARFLLAFILWIWLKNIGRPAGWPLVCVTSKRARALGLGSAGWEMANGAFGLAGGLEQVEQRCSFEQPKLVVLCKGKE